MSVSGILHWSRQRAVWILLGATTGVVFSLAYCWYATPIFRSQAEILVMREAPPNTMRAGNAGNLDEEILATHLQIVRSPTVVARALAEYGLEDCPSILAAKDETQTPVEYVIEHLQTHKGGEGSGRTAQVLHLRLRHTDADDCQAILEAVVSSYEAFLKDLDQLQNDEALTFARQQRDASVAKLAEEESAQRTFRETAPNLWKGQESVNGPGLRAEELESELTALRKQRIDVEARLRAMRLAATGKPVTEQTYVELMAMVDQQHLNQLKSMLEMGKDGNRDDDQFDYTLVQLEIDRAQLLTRYGIRHPKVVEIQQAIDHTETFLKERAAASTALPPRTVVAFYVTSLRGQLSNLEWRYDETARLLEEAKAEAKALVQFELREKQLLDQIAQQQQFLSQHEKILLDAERAADADDFITIRLAPPELGEQISPRLAALLPLGTFAGLALALGFLVLVEQSRQVTTRTSASISSATVTSWNQSADAAEASQPRWGASPSAATP